MNNECSYSNTLASISQNKFLVFVDLGRLLHPNKHPSTKILFDGILIRSFTYNALISM